MPNDQVSWIETEAGKKAARDFIALTDGKLPNLVLIKATLANVETYFIALATKDGEPCKPDEATSFPALWVWAGGREMMNLIGPPVGGGPVYFVDAIPGVKVGIELGGRQWEDQVDAWPKEV